MVTDTITLVTGISATAGRLSGKEQKILTANDKREMREKMGDMLSSLVYTVGEMDLSAMTATERLTFFDRMPSCDKQKLLVDIRQNSLDHDTVFDFPFEYKTKNSKIETVTIECDLSDGFPITYPKTFDPKVIEGVTSLRELKKILANLPVAEYTSYAAVLEDAHVHAFLPKTKTKFRFTRLNSKGEEIAAASKQTSSHTPLLMRNPVYFQPGNDTPIRFTDADLDKLELVDIEFMRHLIRSVEGKLDTEYKFEHPDAKNQDADKQDVVISVLGHVSFFYPSGAAI